MSSSKEKCRQRKEKDAGLEPGPNIWNLGKGGREASFKVEEKPRLWGVHENEERSVLRMRE